jgi:outer membrane protein assembly factor BamB
MIETFMAFVCAPPRRASLTPVLLGLTLAAVPVRAQWHQWGGPNRNFIVESTALADKWPEGGPRKLWHRELGDGYSAIVCDDGLLYTMYRRARMDKGEYTVALDAEEGKIVWEHMNPAPYLEPPDQPWGGRGPNSTPLIVGGRLYTVGSRSVLHCFDKKTGEVLWEHDLENEFGARADRHVGYCFSPIAYKNMVIVAGDRERPRQAHSDSTHEVPKIETRGQIDGQTLMAFDQNTGKLIWKGLDFPVGYSSPILINLDGEDQLVFSTYSGLIGVDPNKGDLLWQHAKRGNEVTPVWNGEDLLFYSSVSGSSRGRGLGIKLTREDGKTIPEELYFRKKIKFRQPTPVHVGGYLYGSDEQNLLGVKLDTGKRVWLKRRFPMASCVYADGKLIILDENGQLTLATATPDELRVYSQCQVAERYSFTVPTLVGKTLYIRDRKHIMALDLS